MRLDVFLWYVRLAKTRSIAQGLAESGRLRIDGRRIERAHCPVRLGDTLTFPQGERVRVVRVLALPTRRGPAPEAQACYAELGANVSQQAAAD
ncbi:MAG: RNA-binding S4 domain-containing protein [Pseudomonadota bacterium]